MFRSLRNRLILSHVLPFLVIIPILGLTLTYLLETRYFLPQMADDLAGSARVLANLSADQPQVWISPLYAQAMLQDTYSETSAQVMLLTTDSRLIASSLPIPDSMVGAQMDFPDAQEVFNGKTVQVIHFSPGENEEAIDIFTPSISASGEIMGIVRVTYRAAIFYQEFHTFKEIIGGVLIFALVFGSALGSILAFTISRPILRATQQIYKVAHGEGRTQEAEYGPEEVRMLLRAMNFLVEQLNNLEQSRRQLLANLVHELGRPLGALRSAIQALDHGASNDPELFADLTQGMDQETIRLQHLVEDLAHLHDQSLGVMEIDHQPINPSRWLPTILPSWRQAAIEKRLHWKETIPKDLPNIIADPIRLAQILGNLLSNAVKYTPTGGTVALSAGADQNSVWFKVSDTGPGISAEDIKNIFNPYYRGHQRNRIQQGMGLGLSITRDLVSAHGGTIQVDSTPGLGSQFTVLIPRQTENASELKFS